MDAESIEKESRITLLTFTASPNNIILVDWPMPIENSGGPK